MGNDNQQNAKGQVQRGLCRALDDVEDWYGKYERGLDTAGATSASMHFGDHAYEIAQADDRLETTRRALISTKRYCAGPRNEALRAECDDFLARIESAVSHAT